MTKAEIRRLQKELRKGLSSEELLSRSNHIWERLVATEAYQSSKDIFCFVSLGDEVDTHKIITESLHRGKRVYVPRVEARRMEFYQITDLEHLSRSKFGILEPDACEETRVTFENNPDIFIKIKDPSKCYQNLMLLPGLAFDSMGNRIGYGAGYYDKYLASFPKATFYKIALAFEFQLLEEIPYEAYDQRADVIITPKEVLICKNENL